MGTNVNRFWEDRQLSQELQLIIENRCDHFNGLPVSNNLEINRPASVAQNSTVTDNLLAPAQDWENKDSPANEAVCTVRK